MESFFLFLQSATYLLLIILWMWYNFGSNFWIDFVLKSLINSGPAGFIVDNWILLMYSLQYILPKHSTRLHILCVHVKMMFVLQLTHIYAVFLFTIFYKIKELKYKQNTHHTIFLHYFYRWFSYRVIWMVEYTKYKQIHTLISSKKVHECFEIKGLINAIWVIITKFENIQLISMVDISIY